MNVAAPCLSILIGRTFRSDALPLTSLSHTSDALSTTTSAADSSPLTTNPVQSYSRTALISYRVSSIDDPANKISRPLTRALKEMARGGRGGGSRNPANQSREVQVSRKVSWLLRHGASSEGLKLGKGGYVSVADALNTRALKSLNITFDELKGVVVQNDKQRFSMIPASSLDTVSESGAEPSQEAPAQGGQYSDNANEYVIRANQGHSIKVDTEGLLTPVTRDAGNVPRIVVHGTDERAWSLILRGGGLRRMTRNHIHFASGLPTGFKTLSSSSDDRVEDAAPVISGMRMSSTVLIYIDINAALDAGIPFFVSENGVILSEGNEQGVLSYEFFTRVESRKKDGGVLMSGGKLPEGVVVDVEEWEKEMRNVGGKRGGRGGRGGRSGRGGKPRINDDERDVRAEAE